MDEIRFKKEDGNISRCCNVEASNPILADKKDVEKLRGDAIGDTLYSESAVLKTLMCLSKFSVDDWSEELEEQLCFLWDMTFEKDVVAVLLKHHFTTLAYQAIQTSSEPRFVEILIGILGNMTAVKEVRLLLSQSCYIELFLSLLSSSDARTLLQLVRLLNSCVWHVNSTISSLEEHDEDEIQDSVAEVEVWISHMKEGAPALNEHLSFILRSSVNEELLLSTLELLNNLSSLKYKSDSGNKFLSLPVLLQGLIEALHQLLGLKEDSALVTIAWDDRVEKAAHHWTLTLSSFSDTASDFLYDQRKVVMRSICSILDPLILHENIFPLNSRKLDIMDVVQEILHAFQVKHNYSPPAILPRLLTILDHLSPKQASHDSLHPEEMLDFLNNGDQERPTELCNNIFEYCLTIMCHTETEDFLEAFGDNPIPKVTILLSNLSSSKNSDMHKLANVIQRYLS